MHCLKYVLVIFALVFAVDAQIYSRRKCPRNVLAKTSFDWTTFSGVTWYEVWKYPNANQTGVGCTKWTFSGTAPAFVLTYGTQPIVNNAPQTGVAYTIPFTMADPSIGVLTGNWPWSSDDLVILDTDYSTYVVFYSCNNQFIFHKNEYAWVLQADPTTPVVIDYTALATATGVNINYADFVPTFQDASACT